MARLADTDAASQRTALGLVPGTDVQSYDVDLAAIAALTTAAFGRSLLTKADAASIKALLTIAVGDVAGAAPLAGANFTSITVPNVTAGDASTKAANTAFVNAAIAAVINGAPAALDTLVEIAAQLANDESAVGALTTTVAGKLAKSSNLSDLANAATARTNMGVAIGSNVQAWDADLDAISTLTTTVYGRSLLTLVSAVALTAALNAVVGDTGTGGTKGLVPAPAAGDAAAGKVLRADGTWAAILLSGFPSAFATKSANYTVLTSDANTQFTLTGSATLTLPSASAMGAGKGISVKKIDGTGQWTIGGTVDGKSNIQMYSEGGYAIVSDGANWVTQGRPKGPVNMGSATVPSAIASVAFSTGFGDPEIGVIEWAFSNLAGSVSAIPRVLVSKSALYSALYTGFVNYFGGSGTSYVPSSAQIPISNTIAAGNSIAGTVTFFGTNVAATTGPSVRVESVCAAASLQTIGRAAENGSAALTHAIATSFPSCNNGSNTVTQKGFRQ